MSALDPSAPGLPLAGGGGGGGAVTLTGDTTGSGTGTIATTTSDLTIASEARGDLLRRGASSWQRVAAKTAGNLVGGDGTDVVSVPIATPLAVSPTANLVALGLLAQPDLSSGTIVPGTDVTGAATATAFTATIASGALANAVATNTVPWPSTLDTSITLTARVVCSGAGAGARAAILKLLYGAAAAGDFLELDVDDSGNVSLIDQTGSIGGQSAPTPTRTTTWIRLRVCGKRVTAWNSATGIFTSPFYDADLSWLVIATANSYATIASLFASGGQYGTTADASGSVVVDNLTIRPVS